jgi:LysM repeat protein
MLDQYTTLCLACSCSLPPLKNSPSTSAAIFLTPCCCRPICPSCIAANPRLERYDPCLACFGGVGVVRSGSGTPAHQVLDNYSSINVDGAVRDEDTFVLGDDEEDDDDLPDKVPIAPEPSHPRGDPNLTLTTEEPTNTDEAVPSKYYIARNDTLQGIALRYGLNVSENQPSTTC